MSHNHKTPNQAPDRDPLSRKISRRQRAAAIVAGLGLPTFVGATLAQNAGASPEGVNTPAMTAGEHLANVEGPKDYINDVEKRMTDILGQLQKTPGVINTDGKKSKYISGKETGLWGDQFAAFAPNATDPRYFDEVGVQFQKRPDGSVFVSSLVIYLAANADQAPKLEGAYTLAFGKNNYEYAPSNSIELLAHPPGQDPSKSTIYRISAASNLPKDPLAPNHVEYSDNPAAVEKQVDSLFSKAEYIVKHQQTRKIATEAVAKKSK
ncbi:MAG TPA: hypothetical protein VHD84_01030 [Candidatus Saccharimonadales bacterium]|nr:hypothetical protein [Candidatus Saccharimonadales bacterium]